MEDLSQAIQNIGIDPNFPRIMSPKHLEEIQSAASYLSAAVMDCLASLIDYLNHSGLPLLRITAERSGVGRFFITLDPEIDDAKRRVIEKIQFYEKATSTVATALQVDRGFRDHQSNLLKWILPENSEIYLIPKGQDEIQGTGTWFLTSPEYSTWVGGELQSTIICSGQGIHPRHCN